MKTILLFLLLLATATGVSAQGATAAIPKLYESVAALPASCNPQLRTQLLAVVKGGTEFICVAVPNAVAASAAQVAAAKKIGTYQRKTGSAANYTFTGLNATVDAHTDQAEQFATRGFSNYAQGGTGAEIFSIAVFNAAGLVEIYDMDYTTPLNITACAGYPPVNIVPNANPTLVKYTTDRSLEAGSKFARWCFQGEDARYRVVYPRPAATVSQGDVNDWIWIADQRADKAGQVNIMDFGGAGFCLPDGTTSCFRAYKSAMHWLAGHYGGELAFPSGDWLVDTPVGQRPVTIPSNVTIRGVAGGASDITTGTGGVPNQRAPTRLKITQAGNTIARIGELTDKIAFRDIEFYSTNGTNTVGVEGLGAFNSSQGFLFSNVTFTGFWRGIYTRKINLPTSDLDESWQFDYLQLENSRFTYNLDAALYSDAQNSDWHIKGVHIIQPPQLPSSYTTTPTQAARGFVFNRSALVSMSQVFGGGTGEGEQTGGIFLTFNGSAGVVSMDSVQCENTWGSITYAGAGEYSYPFLLKNVVFGNKIRILAARGITSTASLYGPDTWVVGGETRIWSVGDRFCYDANSRGCSNAGLTAPIARTFFDLATVMFMTGSPQENDGNLTLPSTFNYSLPSYPTQIDGGLKLSSFATLGTTTFAGLSALTSVAGIANGSMIYCSDCTKGSKPCTVSSDPATQGALVVRANISNDARWECN